jgi:hypothetical protein
MKNYNSSGPPSTAKPRIYPKTSDQTKEHVLNATRSERQLLNLQNYNFETTFENFKFTKDDRNSSQEIQRNKQSNIKIAQNNI